MIEDIKHGNIALPEIQRPFVWSAAKTRDLLDSMYRGYPVGTLVFWETGADVGTRQIGGERGDRVAKLLIVDGQQRLTSLFAVLTGSAVLTKDFEKRRIRLAFRPSDETFEVTDAAIERDPEFVPDITALWDEGYKSTVRKFLHGLSASRGASWMMLNRIVWKSESIECVTSGISGFRSSNWERTPTRSRLQKFLCGSTPKASDSTKLISS